MLRLPAPLLPRLRPSRERLIELGGSLLIALVVFGVSLNFKILNPLFIDWCLGWDSDLAVDFQALTFYRRAAWSFPVITFANNMEFPVGVNIILMDSLPLLTVPAKIFTRLLPERFQFWGLWLLACHWLQAFYGFKLLRTLDVSRLLSWCGAALLCGASPLVVRHGHTQLCAQWMILASMLAVVRSTPSLSLVVLPSLGLWIHAYFMPMCLPFCVAGQLKFWRTPNAVWRALATLGGLLVSLTLLGFFALPHTQNHGYEFYLADLSTFFNPMGMASIWRFEPPHALAPGEWEGSAYLGCAGFVLAFALLGALALPRFRRSVAATWPVLLVCLLFAFYAFTATPHLFGEPLVRLETLSRWLAPIGTRFRGTGRFIWPLHYYVMIFGLKALQELTARLPHLMPRLQLIGPALVVLQALDLGPHYRILGSNPLLTAKVDLTVPPEIQAQLTSETQFLFFWPPIKVPCGHAHWRGPYYNLSMFAAEHGLITNADLGINRISREDRQKVCKFTQGLLKHPERYKNAIFVVQ